MAHERRYLTPSEVASELRVSTDTVLRLIASGELAALRVSPRVIRIPEPAFRRFLDGRPVARRRVTTVPSTVELSIGADEDIPRHEPA